MTKQCRECGQWKPAEDFCKDNKTRDGLHSYCRTCNYVRYVRWRRENLERFAAGQKRYRENHKLERCAAYEAAVANGVTKHCSNCGEIKSAGEFSFSVSEQQGIHNSCKACTQKGFKEWAERNPERAKSSRETYLEAHREERLTYYRAYNKAWYAAHKEEICAKQRAYRADHRDEINQRNRAAYAVKKRQQQLESEGAA